MISRSTSTRLFIIIGIVLAYATISFASQSSESYQLTTEQIDAGGNRATSTNYSVEGTIGPFVSGQLISPQYVIGASGGGGSQGGGSGENQASPEVSSIIFSSLDNGTSTSFSEGISLAIGTTTYHVYGTVVDANGAGTITSVSARLYRNGVAGGSACVADQFNCYNTSSACVYTPETSVTGHYDCAFSLASYADATDVVGAYPSDYWTALVTVTDITGFSSSRTGDIEMNSIAALSFPATIEFADMSLGATTTASTSESLEFVQIGNAVSDVLVSSNTNFTCSQAGYIPKENLKWSLTNVGYDDLSASAFSSIPSPTSIGVPRKVSQATTSEMMYFNLGIPQEGLGGLCGGSVLFSVIQN